MSDYVCPKNPPLKSGKPELGKTRTLSSGELQYKDDTGMWRMYKLCMWSNQMFNANKA